MVVMCLRTPCPFKRSFQIQNIEFLFRGHDCSVHNESVVGPSAVFSGSHSVADALYSDTVSVLCPSIPVLTMSLSTLASPLCPLGWQVLHLILPVSPRRTLASLPPPSISYRLLRTGKLVGQDCFCS